MERSTDQPSPPVRAYQLLVHYGSYLQSAVLLIVRLAWGFELYVSGHSHLQNVPAMVDRFQKWGVPFPQANVYISGVTEMVGGTLLLLGVGSRLVSIPLVFNFIVAYLTASREVVRHLFTNPIAVDTWDGFFSDAAWPFLVAALIVLAFGPGKVSVDHLLHRTVFRGRAPDTL